MKPSLNLPQPESNRGTLARQLGIDQAVTGLPNTETDAAPWEYDPLLSMANRYRDAGFDIAVIESRPPMDAIMVGGEAREAQIESVTTLIENLGRLNVPVWCPVWMAKHNWARTAIALPDRGGSLVSGFDLDDLDRAPRLGSVSEETLWENLESFLDRIVPVAETAGVKLAWHPDDPPLSPFRGLGRILSSLEDFDRLLSIRESPVNGITLCQGNFRLMADDLPSVIREYGDRIHYVHFRDVAGNREHFRETWHDAGPTDMLACLEAYADIGYEGVIRPDHVPTMAGEDNSTPGYHTKGRLWAVGYLTGLLEQVESLQ